MNKALLLIFIALFSFSAIGKSRIVLLISLDPETSRPPLRTRRWDINKKLEKVFVRKLRKKNFELVVIPFTRQTQLRKELLNPNNHAVFWVGHSSKTGVLSSSGMYDDQGFNMKEVFQEVHQNIKFLGIVGCQSLPFVKSLKSNGYWDLNTHLNTYSRKKKTDARKGLKRAIKSFLKSKVKEAPHCRERELVEVIVNRKSSLTLSSARILRKGKLIATFNEGEEQTVIFIPKDVTRGNLKLVLESGAPNNSSENNFNLGRLEFDSNHPNLSWKLFSDRQGNPIGYGSHVYKFNGNLDIELSTISSLPKQCSLN